MRTIAVMVLLILAGCASPISTTRGSVHHVALCWLKAPGNRVHRKSIIEASKLFREIPGVLDVRIGQPISSDRDIVDDSFDVAISVSFADVESMNHYLAHPIHENAKREVLLPIVRKLLIYDFKE